MVYIFRFASKVLFPAILNLEPKFNEESERKVLKCKGYETFVLENC